MISFDVAFNFVFLTIFVYHVFYFMVQYFVIKRVELFYYSLFLLSASCYYFVFDSAKVFQLPIQSVITRISTPIEQSFSFIQTFFYVSFIGPYLQIGKATPRTYKWLQFYRYYNLVFLMAFPLFYFAHLETAGLYAIVSILTMPFTIFTVLLLWRLKNIYATVLLIGTSCTVFGMLISFPLLVNPSLLPINVFIPAQIGLLLDLFVLGYGLSLKAAESDKKLVGQLLQNQKLLEAERTRFARDIQDGLGGILNKVKLTFSNTKNSLTLNHSQHQAFDQSLSKLDAGIGELRRIAHNMMPENLQQLGLELALKDFCNSIQQGTDCSISFQSYGMDGLSPDQTIDLEFYRIAQELINNALKHSQALQIAVSVKLSMRRLILEVVDNGIGFSTDTLKMVKGSGWKSIESRVNLLNGVLHLASGDKGTSVNIEIPLQTK